MYTEIGWLNEDDLNLGVATTPKPDPVPAGLVCGGDMLALARVEFPPLVKLFGSARDIMRKRFLPWCEWLDLDCWLSHLERLTRCALLMLALRVAPPRGPSIAPQTAEVEVRTPRDGATKSVPRSCSFTVLSKRNATRESDARGANLGMRRVMVGVWRSHRLAMRIDALLRVLNEPALAVQRLALKLAGIARDARMSKPRHLREEDPVKRRGEPSPQVVDAHRRAWPQLKRDCAHYFAPS